MGGRSSRSNMGSNTKSYYDYPTTGTDTLIVERNGQYVIERYAGQNLDEYDHTLELNHDELAGLKYNSTDTNSRLLGEVFRNIKISDILDYLRKEFNYNYGR